MLSLRDSILNIGKVKNQKISLLNDYLLSVFDVYTMSRCSDVTAGEIVVDGLLVIVENHLADTSLRTV